MNNLIHVVDLFSGPGGLGEGVCSSSGQDNSPSFKIGVSIEKDEAAHKTLRLRSFLRKFDQYPSQYYEWLAGDSIEPDWAALYPVQWAAAEHEVWQAELGVPSTTAKLSARIQEIKAYSGHQTLLIGGPPCQAYSLVGRSRNSGNKDYMPSSDHRHFLYQEYCRVLSEFSPSVFVMENVKGLLSSSIEGLAIFETVLCDLEAAGEGYSLFALSGSGHGESRPDPRDFVLRSEDFGVPQARHRVIIVGIKRSIAEKLPKSCLPGLTKSSSKSLVKDVLKGMPKLRSGLSKQDSQSAWYHAVHDAIEKVHRCLPLYAGKHKDKFVKQLNKVRVESKKRDKKRRSLSLSKSSRKPTIELWSFLHDGRLTALSCNETRGHMPTDLARYLYASCYALAEDKSPKAPEFPTPLAPNHVNWESGKFSDRFRVQLWNEPATTITSHISKDGHYYIHPDATQCRSLTVREAARLQTFPDNYHFLGNRTQQYTQVGNAVPPYLAKKIAEALMPVFNQIKNIDK